MPLEKEISFHDSTVTNFQTTGENIFIELVDVLVNNRQTSASLIFYKVKIFETNSAYDKGNLMPTEDGEILSLSFTKNSAEITIQWNDFAEDNEIINNYKIICESIKLNANNIEITL